jgi:hypothetical protein
LAANAGAQAPRVREAARGGMAELEGEVEREREGKRAI